MKNLQFKNNNSKLYNNSFYKSSIAKPLVSVITVVHNGEKYLEQCINSIINQTYSNIEYIIIDGGSTDGTVDIIKKYEDKIDYWVSEKDSGIYDAMNKGISVSKGSWLAFIGSDDIMKENAIEKYIEILSICPHVKYISSKIELVNNKNAVISIIGKPFNYKLLKKYMNVAHVASLHHKSLFNNYGLFDTSYKIAADYEFLLRVGKSIDTIFLNEVTASMLNEGVSNQNINAVFKEATRAKIMTGKRNMLLSYTEYCFWYFKRFIKEMLNKKLF